MGALKRHVKKQTEALVKEPAFLNERFKGAQRLYFLSAPAAFASGSSLTGIPNFIFTSRSIFLRSSAFSLSDTLAFSLPWPNRSPLYENQAPLFSTTRLFTARSSKSPSREIPSPYMMSNSHSRNG